jgi:lipoate-protein ligase B
MATPSTSTSRRSDEGARASASEASSARSGQGAGAAAPGPLAILDWGRTEYRDALARQHALVADRLAGRVPDTLVLTEHDPVVTLGRGARPENLIAPSCPVVPVERGGDVTWHGPGQVVGYLVRLLPPDRHDLLAHLREIEDLVIASLAPFGLSGSRSDAGTGVWVHHGGRLRKIASIGIAAKSWCTYHGFALNVDCDLAAFRAINPCGFDASVMTSLRDVLGTSPGLEAVKSSIRSATHE